MSNFADWGGGSRGEESLYFMWFFVSCLTHLSEKCVKMKPKCRLPAQTLAASIAGL